MLLIAGNLVYDWIAGPVEELSWDQTNWTREFADGLGGNGATTAFAAARAGASVRLITGCAEDPPGLACRQMLSDAGVDGVYLPGLPGGTALTMGLFRSDGARALFHRPGVSAKAFGEVPSLSPYGEGIRWLHIANPFGVAALRRKAADYLCEAKEAGWQTSMDLGWDRLGEWGSVVEPCLPYCDWLLANEAEAAKVNLGARSGVVIKRGAAGCSVDDVPVPAAPAVPVDSTGAGDCFCGAFLAAMLAGYSPLMAARAGNAFGAICVGAAGGTTGVRTWTGTLGELTGAS